MEDVRHYYCPNSRCADHGIRGKGNLTVGFAYGKKNRRMLYCCTCKTRFSETKCSPFFQTKYGAETIGSILRCTAEGNGVRATARILGLSKDAVNHVILKAGEYCAGVMKQILVDLQLTEAQMDELWSFVEKKVVKSAKSVKSGCGQPLTQRRDC